MKRWKLEFCRKAGRLFLMNKGILRIFCLYQFQQKEAYFIAVLSFLFCISFSSPKLDTVNP